MIELDYVGPTLTWCNTDLFTQIRAEFSNKHLCVFVNIYAVTDVFRVKSAVQINILLNSYRFVGYTFEVAEF